MRMLRGETVAATLGLMLGAVLLVVLAASSFWTLYTASSSITAARRDHITSTSVLLTQAVESQLAAGELTALRRLITETARTNGLDECRVVLPGGGILADADPSLVTVMRLAAQWPEGQLDELETTINEHGARLVSELSIPGRGTARLIIGDGRRHAPWGTWQVRAGLGGIAVIGLSGLLITYRWMRTRLRALTAVGEALTAASAGERCVDVLRVDDSFGAAATAWNAMLDECHDLRRQAEQVTAPGKSGGAGSGIDREIRNACDALWMGVVMIDSSMHVTYVNGAAAVLLSKSREELEGTSLSLAVQLGDGAEVIKGVAAGTLRRRESFEVRLGDGAVLRFACRAVRSEGSSAAIIIVTDVTQQKAADEARNSLVSQATHELRTPLTNIRLYIDALIDQQDDDPAARLKCINVISEESRRLERIVGDMLSVAEIEAGTMSVNRGDVRLEPLLQELRADYEAQAQDKEISLTFDHPPKWPTLFADRDKLTLALHNLLGNALKYTPVGGRVGVMVETQADPAKGDVLLVHVSDNGIGIRPEEHELIFEQFYRAKDNRISSITGSGLGLALARQIARQHGGDITVSSELDKGSTFTLVVPLSTAPSAAGTTLSRAA